MPEIEDATAATKGFLESYLEQPHSGSKLPTRAQLLGEDGRLIADFRLTPSGAEPVFTTGT